MMKKSAFGIFLMASTIAGCSERPVESVDAAEIDNDVINKFSQEESELRKFKEEAVINDPLFRDAYYSVNENGERQLVIVRESPDNFEDSQVSTLAVAALAGLTGAALASAILSPTGSHYSHYKNAPRSVGSSLMMKKKKEEERAAYISSAYSNARSARLAAEQANKSSSPGSKALSTSKPAFSSGSSTRGGAYGSSGG